MTRIIICIIIIIKKLKRISLDNNVTNIINMSRLTIKYLIDLLNDHQVDNRCDYKLIVDTYQSLVFGNSISFDNMIKMLMVACEDCDNNITDVQLKNEKQNIRNKIFNSPIEISRKKKYISLIESNSNTQILADINNELIILLTYYFDINLIIYNPYTKLSKCFYFDNFLDKDLPFIIIKEMKALVTTKSYHELVTNQKKYTFSYIDPIIDELIKKSFIIGLDHGKQLQYLNTNITFIEKKNIRPTIKLKLLPLKFYKSFNPNNLK